MSNGMILVCGVPRSGTSLCMDIQREAHGEDCIVGSKFPQEKENKQQPNESVEKFEIRNWINDFRNKKRNEIIERQREELGELYEEKSDKKDYKDMNPEGFWECAFTVRGIMYSPRMKDVLKEVRKGAKKICKVVCSGLLNSDPSYIEKIIFTIRDPHSVAKSQERLGRQSFLEELKMHTPEMFIQNIVQASRFFIDNPNIPVMFYHFDDLVERPKEIIDQMQEFIGSGDYSKAYDLVQPKLNRSKEHEHVDNPLFSDAETIYELFCEKKFQEVIEYMEDPKRQFNREKTNWPCPRVGSNVNDLMCKMCYNDKNVAKNVKESATLRGINWEDKPCFFECGFDVDRDKYITIEESIKKNFWKKIKINDTLLDIVEQEAVLERMLADGAKDCEIECQIKWIDKLKEK